MYYAIVGLFLPLAGFLILLSTSKWIGRKAAGILACSTLFISFLCFASLVFQFQEAFTVTLYNWLPVQGLNTDFALRIDPLALLMTLIITGIGFLIHVYSIGYMEHDEDYARYFACLNFFVFAMLLLVLSANLLLLFVGWEGVGLASYLLIGYWYHRPAAAKAATKAFVVNRIGDLGLLLGLLLTFYLFGTSDIVAISSQAGSVDAALLTILTLLYFVGAIGKSAQLPLHTWLPDAMEGPTPVSALIHAATMVTAGVYLVVRMHAVFILAPTTLQVIGVVGGATSLFAALCAVGQTDLKRVLAYSTVSQLGLMFLACGVGAFYAAMFHLTTHAFVKALLFLSAGNVVHMMHGTTQMENMGGLRKIFTKTNWLFLIGVLAMSGVPPFAAFFSKDLILEVEYLAGFEKLFFVGVATSILTGFYLMRAYALTFLGPLRLNEKNLKMVEEAPPVMLWPLSILAFLSIVGGLLGFCVLGCKTPILEKFISDVGITLAERDLTSGLHLTFETWIAIIGALMGVGLSLYIYTRPDRVVQTWTFLKKAFYIDEIYWTLLGQPLAKIARFIDDHIEPKFFDGSIQIATSSTQETARWLQKVQSGQIRSYVAWMVIGTVLLIAYFTF